MSLRSLRAQLNRALGKMPRCTGPWIEFREGTREELDAMPPPDDTCRHCGEKHPGVIKYIEIVRPEGEPRGNFLQEVVGPPENLPC